MILKQNRRLRYNSVLRNLVEETKLNIDNFIYPLFVRSGKNIKNEIKSMPDVYQMSIDEVIKECFELKKLKIFSIILFGISDNKDEIGKDALSENGIIPKAIREIKKNHPDIFIITDLCFCEYTNHGHCGVINRTLKTVDNNLTLKNLLIQAKIHCNSGVDMIAPSGMMDGVVKFLREGLDSSNFYNIPIMSYSTKFSSGYYGPFKEVAENSPSFGDRNSYQLNPANRKEAILESLRDEEEGADILMVKPALAYLDIVRDIKDKIYIPLAIYNVSGEYSMLKFAEKNNLIDYKRVLLENMISFKRAGADIIISYHSKEIAKELLLKYS